MRRFIFSSVKAANIFLLITVSLILSGQTDKTVLMPQYLFPDFSNCSVKMKGGQNQTSMMNFNTVSERMVFLKDGNYFDLVNAEMVDTIIINSRIFVPFGKTFFEFIPCKSIPLFIEYKGSLTKPGKSVGYGGTSEIAVGGSMSSVDVSGMVYNLPMPPDFNVKISKVFWIRKDNKISDFLNERQFIKLFPDKSDLIKQFIKNNKLRFEKQEHVIQIVSYCASLN